ncbi:MAG: 5'/3'-nucleotidase SurE [Elusimicrobia bacterium]|nr:5'/3'-nucleotidase SurE [Elusimicrobiota bacterium]
MSRKRMTRPLILLCNDDGIGSPGLRAAVEAVSGLGELLVVAPKTQQTAAGRSLVGPDHAVLEPVSYRISGRKIRAYQVECSPAMLVDLAFAILFTDRKPSLVVSGINYGENAGAAVTASGTVGAALEAASLGVPSLATSRQVEIKHHLRYGRLDWSAAKHFTRIFAKKLLGRRFPEGVDVFNLNVPASAKKSTPWRLTRVSRQSYFAFEIAKPTLSSKLGDGRVKVRLGHDFLEKDSDIHALLHDHVVSVSPLTSDLTSRVDAGKLSAWLSNGARSRQPGLQ